MPGAVGRPRGRYRRLAAAGSDVQNPLAGRDADRTEKMRGETLVLSQVPFAISSPVLARLAVPALNLRDVGHVLLLCHFVTILGLAAADLAARTIASSALAADGCLRRARLLAETVRPPASRTALLTHARPGIVQMPLFLPRLLLR